VLLLSPIFYLAGWLCVTWWLEPKPRYTLDFSAKEQARVAWPIGAYLRILIQDNTTPPLGHYHRICRIDDGQFLNNIAAGLDKEALRHPFKADGLPQKPYRYDVFKNDTDDSSDYLLSDYETGKVHQFCKQPARGYFDCTLNRPHSHCLMAVDLSFVIGRVTVENMFALSPIPLVCLLSSIAQFDVPHSYWRDASVLSVVTVPEKHVVVSQIINPFLAYRSYIHNSIFIRSLSPSGRWLVVGDDSDRDVNNPQDSKWTKLYLYDTVSQRWNGILASLDGLVYEIAFPSDDVLVIYLREGPRPSERIFLHVPTGKVVDQFEDQRFNSPRLCQEAGGAESHKKIS